jgi:hypothetical protein
VVNPGHHRHCGVSGRDDWLEVSLEEPATGTHHLPGHECGLNEVAEHLGDADPGFTARTYADVMRDAARRRRVPITQAIQTARAAASRRPLVDPSRPAARCFTN